MKFEKNLTSTLEDYLLTVYRLEREKRVARPRDIGRLRKVAKSTVTSALKSLAGKGLINYQPYEAATLTPEGKKTAEWLIIRNRVLRDFLQEVLGLSARKATITACGMEHALDSATVERFVRLMAFIKTYGPSGVDWRKKLREYASGNGLEGPGESYVQDYLNELKSNYFKSGGE